MNATLVMGFEGGVNGIGLLLMMTRGSTRKPSGRLRCASSMTDKTLIESQTKASASASKSKSKSKSRRLILLRHAKSCQKDPSVRADHDRTLSKPGCADAVAVSQKLQQLSWVPELILSSDSVRTKETIKIMQETMQGFSKAKVRFISSFYSVAAMDGQTAEHLQQAICKYSSDDIFTIMCVGHNKGWEEAASMFVGDFIELKTCNAALLEAAGKTWEEAFFLAGIGGWRLQGIVKPSSM